MESPQIDGSKLEWLSLGQVRERYLRKTKLKNGKSARDLLRALSEQKSFETNCFMESGAKAADRPLYESHVRPIDEGMKVIRVVVMKRMIDDATAGRWVAVGRQHPDADAELIPPRYWPFLELDIFNGLATGEGMKFRAISCVFLEDVPANHPIRTALQEAEARPARKSSDGHAIRSEDPPSPKAPPRQSGAPGRPSSMHLVEAEFARRARTGESEATLSKEAEALEDWLKKQHPDMPRAKAKSIRNHISAAFRRTKLGQSPA